MPKKVGFLLFMGKTNVMHNLSIFSDNFRACA